MPTKNITLHRTLDLSSGDTTITCDISHQKNDIFHFSAPANLEGPNDLLCLFLTTIPTMPHYNDVKHDELIAKNPCAVSKVEIKARTT